MEVSKHIIFDNYFTIEMLKYSSNANYSNPSNFTVFNGNFGFMLIKVKVFGLYPVMLVLNESNPISYSESSFFS